MLRHIKRVDFSVTLITLSDMAVCSEAVSRGGKEGAIKVRLQSIIKHEKHTFSLVFALSFLLVCSAPDMAA